MYAAVEARSNRKVCSLELAGRIWKIVRASRSQLALSSGVVATICPRICRPVRKSLRLKAASASVFRVALVLATAPASLLIWASSLIAESARSSRLKALSAACAVTRPNASVAQTVAARTKPIMGGSLGPRTSAACQKDARQKVTDSWRWNAGVKESHATFVEADPLGEAGRRRRCSGASKRAKANGRPRKTLSAG